MSGVFTCPPLVIARNRRAFRTWSNRLSCNGVSTLSEMVEPILCSERIAIDSKKARRIEKKEKKEKLKQKKETEREKSHKHSSRQADDNHHKQHFLSSKKVPDESNQLEKSCLTEELEDPQNHLGYLSDGSQNSKKRKREDSSPAVESLIKAAPVAGNPLRIRLIFKKPKAEVPVPPRKDLVCSTSGAKCLSHQDGITSSISGSKISEPEENQLSTSLAAITDETEKRREHKPSKDDRYNALFDDWTPSSICFTDDSSSKDDDDEWLFGNKRQDMLKPKAAVKIDEDMEMDRL